MTWKFSDDPSDWATQISAIFTAASAVLTAIYVWLTYHLMRWTATTAMLASREHQSVRRRNLGPLHAATREACTIAVALKSAAKARDMMMLSTLAPKIMYASHSFDSELEIVGLESPAMLNSLSAVRILLQLTSETMNVVLRDGISDPIMEKLVAMSDKMQLDARAAFDAIKTELDTPNI